MRDFDELYDLLCRGAGWAEYLNPEFKVVPMPERTDEDLSLLDSLCEGPQTHANMMRQFGWSDRTTRDRFERFVARGWATRERTGSSAWIYTITDEGRRVAIEPCRAPLPGRKKAQPSGGI